MCERFPGLCVNKLHSQSLHLLLFHSQEHLPVYSVGGFQLLFDSSNWR
jgi:hypothetical protein